MATHDASQEIALLLEAANAAGLARRQQDDLRSSRISAEDLDAALLRGAQRASSAAERILPTLRHEKIKNCPECQATLDLPAPVPGCSTETWRCLACSAVMLTGPTDDLEDPIETAERARRENQVPFRQLFSGQPANLKQLVQRLAAVDRVEPEERVYPRYDLSLPVVGAPLDKERRTFRSAIRLTTRDLSLTGISLFSEHPITAPMLLVDFTPAGLHGWQAPIEITRRTTTGFLHEIGGRFIGD